MASRIVNIRRLRKRRDRYVERVNAELAREVLAARAERYPMHEIADALGVARKNAYEFMGRHALEEDTPHAPADAE